jgi:hypothetical protein
VLVSVDSQAGSLFNHCDKQSENPRDRPTFPDIYRVDAAVAMTLPGNSDQPRGDDSLAHNADQNAGAFTTPDATSDYGTSLQESCYGSPTSSVMAHIFEHGR